SQPTASLALASTEAGAGGSVEPAAGETSRPSGGNEARLIARDERKNPLISTFDWTSDAAERVLRVPAGYMRNKTQERIEELARERAVATIDLALVEQGIEIGKQMMAEMIASYSAPGASAGAPAPVRETPTPSAPAN